MHSLAKLTGLHGMLHVNTIDPFDVVYVQFTSHNYRTFEVNKQVKGKITDQKVVKKGIPHAYTCRSIEWNISAGRGNFSCFATVPSIYLLYRDSTAISSRNS